MGARQSKRSVDITTTPKKEGLPVEGVVGDAAAPGDGKLEKIEETDAKPTTNGVAPHTDATPEDKDKDKDEATEKENAKDDETKAEDAKVESPTTEAPAENAAEVTTPTEGTPASPTTATSPDSKETKKKDKMKKKWSFRSISFGKKDKNKPAREDAPKNGDVTKEEPLAEGGEEPETAEVAAAAACSPADDKSSVSSRTEKEQSVEVTEATPEAVKPEEKKTPTIAPAVASSPVDEKKEDNTTPAPITPVPVEAKKFEDNEKQVEPANADKKVEVSQVKAVIDAPVEVKPPSKQKANTATTAPSIIERKTSEDVPSQFPSSPPSTPIDPSPLQKAQQVAANATALAEALKLPAEAANKANISYSSGHNIPGHGITSFPASTWPNEVSSIEPIVLIPQKTHLSAASISPEQTGNASVPLPIAVTSDLVAIGESIEKPSLIRDKDEDRVNEVVTEPEKLETPIETIRSEKARENDLVVETEEGPIPISDDIIVVAKPALVVPDSPVEESKIVKVLMEADEKRDITESPMKIIESSESLLVVEPDEKIELSVEIVETVSEPIIPVEETIETIETRDEDINDKDVPPPLPDSPIPLPKVTSQLLNFITTQIEDSPIIGEIIQDPKIIDVSPVILPCCVSSLQASDPLETSDYVEETNESRVDDQREKSFEIPEEVSGSRLELLSQAIDEAELPSPVIQEIFQESSSSCLVSLSDDVSLTENSSAIDRSALGDQSFVPVQSAVRVTTEITTLLLTPPRSPSNPDDEPNLLNEPTTIESSTSQLELNDDQSNREFKMESVEQSLNSYDDSEHELRERLAESMEENTIVNCQLTNDLQENDQSKTESEAPVENNVVPNDISTTEVDEAPKSPPPAVPAEAPAPILGPAITEDVASVTKAIEEIHINEKAVAAAVTETIESIKTNEIIADMNHQNNMNE